MNTSKNKIEITTQKNGTHIITSNGIPFICPFQNSLVLPGQMANTITIQRMPCTTECPFASIETDGETGRPVYWMRCSTHIKSFMADAWDPVNWDEMPDHKIPGMIIK